MDSRSDFGAGDEYADLLLKHHRIDPHGREESPILDEVVRLMGKAWSKLTGIERARMKGLSQDLYALADGRNGTAMSRQQASEWAKNGDLAVASGSPDAHLAHLRQPFPHEIPASLISFLQAQSWEQIGNLRVALVFMEDSARTLKGALPGCLVYLIQLGMTVEANALARKIIDDPTSPPINVYIGAGVLFLIGRKSTDPRERRNLFEEALSPLLRLIESEKARFPQTRDSMELAASRAATAVLIELLRFSEAVSLSTKTLMKHPKDSGLLMLRGVAKLHNDPASAQEDFEASVNARVSYSLPYVHLANMYSQAHRHLDVLSVSQEALRFSDMPNVVRAGLHQLRVTAYRALGQTPMFIQNEQREAEKLDPASSGEPFQTLMTDRLYSYWESTHHEMSELAPLDLAKRFEYAVETVN